MTARFLTPLKIEQRTRRDGSGWFLLGILGFFSALTGETYWVPIGFYTDLASVPRWPIIYLVAGGKANEAATLHDYLYTSHLVSRRMADAILREASLATGVAPWRAWLMWAGVRIFGGSHWDRS